MLDLQDYEKMQATLKLMGELSKGEKSGKEKGWLSIDEAEANLGIKNV